ncbi:phosphotransferase [Streptomyces sp. NPDC000594]|uniref:phosphotransferase n=1 Tax=Streptomyces sp. NPDC000594 TaxID=3154261 RepID=UPI003329D2D5
MVTGVYREPVDVHLVLRRDTALGPEVLLSRRAGTVYAAGLWHLPSGKLDGPHEDVVTAVIREAAEETGVVIAREDVRAAVTVHHRAPHGGSRIGVLFEVRRWEGVPAVRELAVCDAMGWYPLDALPVPMVAYCRAGLDAYRIGAPLAVHFQDPIDAIVYDPDADRLEAIGSPEPGGPAPAVREFAERAVGRVTSWTDLSWAREDSRVWRARTTTGGTWCVKVHQSDRFQERETAAYRSWVPALGAAAPRLVAADPGLRAVVFTAVPGRPLYGAVLEPGRERRVFHRIGRLAALIHASAPPRPGTGGAPAALRKLERHLVGARTRLVPGDEAFIRTVAEKAARLPALDLVPTHGDLQPRNLLLGEGDAVRVVDFERAQEGPAVRDFVRLADSWADRPDLHEAFTAGYGRPLTGAEEQHLAVESMLDAVSGIQYGARHHDPELAERGLRTLVRLRAGRTT